MNPKPGFERAGWPQNLHALIIVKRLSAFIGLLFCSTAAFAQNIGNWTLNNTLNGTGTAQNSVSPISAGPGVPTTAFNGGSEWYGQNGFPAGSVCNVNAYLQFTITPNSGFELNISSLVLRMRRSNTGSPAGSGPTQWCLRSSQDGFTSDLATGTMNHNYSNYSVLLTGFAHIPTAVTFRLYGYGVTVSSGGNNRLVLDNVSVQGSLFILPLKLQAPEARLADNGNISLNWKAEDIEPKTRFNLQRSRDGLYFETIYSLTENSLNYNQYGYTDHCTWQKIYYRIEGVEPGGISHFSRMVNINRDMAAQFSIEKIVARGKHVQSTVRVPTKGNYTISVFSSTGILLHKQSLVLSKGAQTIPLDLGQFSGGIYILNISGNNNSVSRPFLFPVP